MRQLTTGHAARVADASETESLLIMPTIPQIIEEIGFGPAQYVQLLTMNFTGLGSMAYSLMVMVLAKTIGDDLNLNVAQRTNLIAASGIGIMIGNFSSGPVGDAFGRRRPIIGYYAGMLLFGAANALSHSYYLSLVLLLAFGISVGIGQPIKAALGGEIVPAERRLHSRAADFILIALGGAYAVALIWFDDPDMKHLHYHWLLAMACLPFLVGLVCAIFFLRESPSYLSLHLEYKEAEEILDYMKTMNGKPDVDTLHMPPPPMNLLHRNSINLATEQTVNHSSTIFGQHMWYTTTTLCISAFTAYFNFFGANYCFLQELPTSNALGSPSLNLMIGQLLEIPGIVLFCVVGAYIGRKHLSVLGFLGTSTGILGFVALAMIYGQSVSVVYLQTSFFIFKFFVTGTVMTISTFAFEVYPTKMRALGTGTVLGFGRLGGIVGPKLYGWTEVLTGSFFAFMIIAVFINVLSCVLIMLLSSDPKGKPLDDHLPEEDYKPILDKEEHEIYHHKLSQLRVDTDVLRAVVRFKSKMSSTTPPMTPKDTADYGATKTA
jgi:MFS family permease